MSEVRKTEEMRKRLKVFVTRVKNLARTRHGILLFAGLAWSMTWVVAAAIVGNRSATGLPTTPPFYGREYDLWAFPLNPDVTGDFVEAVARRVVLGIGEPRADKILANVARNLMANIPAYVLPLVPGLLINIGRKLAELS